MLSQKSKILLSKRAVPFLPSELVKNLQVLYCCSASYEKYTVMNHVNSNGERPISTTVEKVESWLDEHPQFVRDYFVLKATRQMVDSWLIFHSAPQHLVRETSWFTNSNSSAASPVRKTSAQELKSGTRLSRSSLDVTWPVLNATYDTNPSFWPQLLQRDAIRFCNSYVIRKILPHLWDEQEIILELVNVISTDLDPYSLCLKVLTNISIFTHADRCSLFLVGGERGDSNRCLVRELFDVPCHSIAEQIQRKEEICILWGICIVGHVGEYEESLNISDCYKNE
ncbi:phosphodiesterase [Caerostris darwini]|uniref:Phosphodiesterase n=1 Tax=Caerostris darwini TaxID=1538125 RepID=A0AAV4QMH9_9ARAC|nr:phosphodiesterase [Caerostris darwini]